MALAADLRLPAATSQERGSQPIADYALLADCNCAALVARMRGPDGLAIVDRRHLLRVYPRCFLGREAVDWLVDREQMTRAEAVALGRRLVAHGLVRHVLDEHDFKDAPLFYRFRADDAGASRAAAAGI